MNPDDPFGDLRDADKTVRLPRPGGAKGAPAAAPTMPVAVGPASVHPARPENIGETAAAAFAIAALNPLVGVASPLLWLASRLNDSLGPDDVDELLERVMSELRRFESEALAVGVQPEAVRLGRYALCATLDDVVMNTAWGGHSSWPVKTLVSTLYGEALGGERFFDILEQLMADPNANIELLELMAICLSIGFIGKYRVMAGGMPQLARLREDLHRALRRVRGSYERDLSANWRGLASPHRLPPSPKAMWIVAGAALALLATLYLVFSLTLRAQSEAVISRLNALVPTAPMAVPAPPKPPAPPPPPVKTLTELQRIETALAPEIADGAVVVIGQPKTITIRIIGRALFESGQIRIGESFKPALAAIAKALNVEPGGITVIGHTDNVPMRGMTNLELSRLRAEAVMNALRARLSSPGRLSAEGMGDSEPLASNQTAAGRERNRRVEVVIPRIDAAPLDAAPTDTAP